MDGLVSSPHTWVHGTFMTWGRVLTPVTNLVLTMLALHVCWPALRLQLDNMMNLELLLSACKQIPAESSHSGSHFSGCRSSSTT